MTSTYRLNQPPHQPKFTFNDQPKMPQSVSERHRPKVLADVVGQGPVLFRIEAFLEAPYSTAFLFEGPTGVGKTTVAMALATELGAVEFGGLEVVKSGMQDAEAVERVLRGLQFTPMLGSGWKVVVVDEADYMSPKAAQLWLSALEDLPERSVIIFTTNNARKFPDRFLDRCERFLFEADGVFHAQDGQALIDRIWLKETGETTSPQLADLRGVIDSAGNLSYRRIVRALEPLLAVRGKRVQAKRSQPKAQRAQAQADPALIDWNAAGERWFAGESLAAIAQSLGISSKTLDRLIIMHYEATMHADNAQIKEKP